MCGTKAQNEMVLQEARKKAQLRMKLQMAQFLQDTIKEMAVSGKNTKGTSLHQFSEFFQQVQPLEHNSCFSFGCYRFVLLALRPAHQILLNSLNYLKMNLL